MIDEIRKMKENSKLEDYKKKGDAWTGDTQGFENLQRNKIFDEFFSELGERFDDHVTISEQSVLARHWWPDESRLDLRTDLHETLSAIKEFSGKKSALEFETFYRKTNSNVKIIFKFQF